MKYFIPIILVCELLIFPLYILGERNTEKIDQLKNTIKRHEDFLSQIEFYDGGTSAGKFGEYHLISLDRGKTWYECKRWEDSKGYYDGWYDLKTARPELVEYRKGINALFDYSRAGGKDTKVLEMLYKKTQ